MTEHAIEFLQISARLAGTAVEGLTDGGPTLLLSVCALLLALAVTRSGSSTTAPDGVAVVPESPGAPWEATSNASVRAVVADADGATAGAVLALETPGGGE